MVDNAIGYRRYHVHVAVITAATALVHTFTDPLHGLPGTRPAAHACMAPAAASPVTAGLHVCDRDNVLLLMKSKHFS